MPPSLFAAKGADAKCACIGSAESFCIEGACLSNTCARGTCAENVFSAIGAYIKGASSNGTGIEGAGRESPSAKSTCDGGVCAVKHLRKHLQSFSILEIELFDMSWWSSINVLLLRYSSLDILLKLGTKVGDG